MAHLNIIKLTNLSRMIRRSIGAHEEAIRLLTALEASLVDKAIREGVLPPPPKRSVSGHLL